MNQNLGDGRDAIAQGRCISRGGVADKRAGARRAGHWDQCAILLDIDGTLLDLAPTPREVWVPPGLAKTLNRLLVRTSGALALVSGRSLNDIDLIFACPCRKSNPNILVV
jgi:hypothetical protein